MNGARDLHRLPHHSPALETAATNVGDDIHDIPGSNMGYLHPKREVIRVRTAGAAVAAMVAIVDFDPVPKRQFLDSF
jgi:hypothetical protein